LRYLLLGVLYVAVYLALGQVLGGQPIARLVVANGVLLLLAAAVCAAIIRRRRDWEGTQRLFWDAFAVGLALWCVGQIGFTVDTLTGQRSWVEWHTMFSLCGGIGPAVALLAFPHRGTRKASIPAVAIKLVSYAMLIGFIDAYFIMVPSVIPGSGPSPRAALLLLVQLQRFILMAGFAAALWVGWRTPWRNTYARLVAGTSLGFVLRLATSSAIATGRYQEGSAYDLAWIVPYFCYLWAALEAPRSPADDTAAFPPRAGWQTAIIANLPVLLMPLIGFGLLRAQPIGPTGDSVRLLLTTLATVAGLALLTLRLSIQSGQLQRADARLRLLAAATEQTADLILITRNDGGFEHANDACVQALGYTREELAGMMLSELLERGFDQMVGHIGIEVRQKGIWRGTLVHRRKDGSAFPASSTVVALRNTDGHVTHFVGVQRDITDELRMRDQLVHSERLSAIGELVAGVAHEINNPLQAVIGCVELLIEENRGAGQQRDLEMVRQEATRAGQIVRNLLSFVRRSSPDRIEADLNQIARSIADLRAHQLGLRNIAMRLELHPEPLLVLVNREEIQQVVLNLVNNAEHAIGDASGSITIKTVPGTRTHALEVIDDGPGVGADVRGRVFEPFFTTKDVGQGTGLGLSIALGIARAHGGTLELCDADVPGERGSAHMSPMADGEASLNRGSEASRGTAGACFVLALPVHASRPALAHETTAPVSRPPATYPVATRPESADTPRGRRSVLVVDDEPSIRALLSRLLVRRGYDVTEAASCADVRAAAAERRFDVVLCDIRLGDGTGGDCVRHLRAAQPDLRRRIVFITGDASSLAADAGEFADLPVLPKPFTASDLDRLLGDIEVSA
jgi:PAS domain S-box-containing protein